MQDTNNKHANKCTHQAYANIPHTHKAHTRTHTQKHTHTRTRTPMCVQPLGNVVKKNVAKVLIVHLRTCACMDVYVHALMCVYVYT